MNLQAAINDHELMQLKDIVDINPQLYLDEIALCFVAATGKHLCCSTIQGYLTGKLNYSLRVLSEIAKQRNEEDQISFLNALDIRLQGYPEWLIMIDKTHKDRNAARRRRRWKRRNTTAEINEWHWSCVRYTLG